MAYYQKEDVLGYILQVLTGFKKLEPETLLKERLEK